MLAHVAQVPVDLGCFRQAVVVELGRVRCADHGVRYGVSEEESEDSVGQQVVLALIPGEDNECTVLVEVGVLEKGLEEGASPFTGNRNRAIVAIACYFGCQCDI